MERGPLTADLRADAHAPGAPVASRRWRWRVLVPLAAAAVLGAAFLGARDLRRHAQAGAAHAPQFVGSDVRPPAGARVRVEVFNATRRHGIGRRAMLYLRDQGFDVVSLGSVRTSRDTTLVVGRGTHLDWARLVARALGASRVDVGADSSRDVDVSVYLGSSWRPPPEPFYP